MVLAAALALALAAPPPPAGSSATPPDAPVLPLVRRGPPAFDGVPAPLPDGAYTPIQHDRLVDEIVAVVRNPASAPPRVITFTKLVEEARIALATRGATEAAWKPLDRAVLRAALEWLIDQMLVADEAAKLRLDDVDREALAAEVRRFRARFRSASDFTTFLLVTEVSEEELAATLARMVRVDRFIQSRVGRSARASEDEVDRWLAERGAAGAGAPARDAARSQLAEDRAKAQVREILADLRGRASIRIVGQLGERGGT